jgi:O-antigen biosynthesis protein
MKIAIYTAIFGGYDQLKPQPPFQGVDYICFTDSELPTVVANWRVIRATATAEHPRLAAKRFKTCPHLFIDPRYDITIWIDGSIVISGADFVTRCISGLGINRIACMNHPVGRCIYQEAAGCLHFEKYRGLPILEQVEHYRTLGYPENNGLAACGIIVRDHRDKVVAQIGEDWLQENVRWTYQDQLSFPYVLWRHNRAFDVLPIDYTDRRVFVLVNHLSEK